MKEEKNNITKIFHMESRNKRIADIAENDQRCDNMIEKTEQSEIEKK